MSEFDDWFKNEMPNSYKKVGKEKIETVIYSCAEAAWKHKQAEVDELRKRIDEAMKYVSESPLKDVSRRAMINFMDILKGDSHES